MQRKCYGNEMFQEEKQFKLQGRSNVQTEMNLNSIHVFWRLFEVCSLHVNALRGIVVMNSYFRGIIFVVVVVS